MSTYRYESDGTNFVFTLTTEIIHIESSRSSLVHHLDRQEEAAGRADPSRVVQRQPACSQNTVSMRVKLQTLIPRVQDAEEADLRAQMTWVTGHLEQCFRTGLKQQAEDHLPVLQGQGREFTWQSEDGVHVSYGQKLPFPRCKPAQAGVALAPRTMPIATGVV